VRRQRPSAVVGFVALGAFKDFPASVVDLDVPHQAIGAFVGFVANGAIDPDILIVFCLVAPKFGGRPPPSFTDRTFVPAQMQRIARVGAFLGFEQVSARGARKPLVALAAVFDLVRTEVLDVEENEIAVRVVTFERHIGVLVFVATLSGESANDFVANRTLTRVFGFVFDQGAFLDETLVASATFEVEFARMMLLDVQFQTVLSSEGLVAKYANGS